MDLRFCAYALMHWYHSQGIEEGVILPNLPSSHTEEKIEKELALLKQEMTLYDGCLLRQTAENTVFSDGCPHSKIMLIGEAPGAEEDRLGKPFVGMSGKLLDKMLSYIELDRSKIYITNVVPWRPPFNRQPSSQEVALCLPFLQKHIAIIQPKILICVGSTAYKALFSPFEKMGALQGRQFFYTCPLTGSSFSTFVVYHPAYLLRSPDKKRLAWRQWLFIRSFLSSASA